MNKIKIIYLFIGSMTLFSSCQLGEKIKNQMPDLKHELAFLMAMGKEYGGSWSSKLGGDCYTIEVTNSKVLNNKDSLDHYKLAIGEKFLEHFGSRKKQCIVINNISEKKIGPLSSSESKSFSILLAPIGLTDDYATEERVKILDIVNTSLSLSLRDYVPNQFLDLAPRSSLHEGYNHLLKTYYYKEIYEEDSIKLYLNKTIQAAELDSTLNVFIGNYHLSNKDFSKAVKFFELFNQFKPNNIQGQSLLLNLYNFNEEYDKAHKFGKNLLDSNPDDIMFLYQTAQAYLKEDSTTMACDLYVRMLDIDSRLASDSTFNSICDIK